MMCVVMTNLGFLVIRGEGGLLDLRVGSHLGFLEVLRGSIRLRTLIYY